VPYNLLQYSEEFDNAVWTKVGCSIITDSIISPNELFYSDYLKENISTSEHRLRFAGIPKSSNQVMTFSAYVKPNGRHLQMSLEYSGVGVQSIFNITNNTYTLSDSASWTRLSTEILNIGDGWYRCSISAITDANVSINARLQLASNPIGGVNQIYTGDGTSGIYIWGAQLVTGTTAKTYFPTTDRLDVPRIDYTGGGCGKLLLEPQRTNLALYSEQIDNAVWTKRNSTISANSATSPDGYTNADKIQEDTTNDRHDIYQDFSCTSGTTYTISAFVKAAERTFCFLSFGSSNVNVNNAFFNLSTGAVVSSPAGVTSTITSYGNGWYRITSTATASGTGVAYVVNGPTLNASGISYQGVSGSGILVYGYGAEAGNYVSSYVPTLASSVTRVAESTSRSGLGLTNSTFVLNFQILSYVAELFDFTKTGGGRMFYIAVQSNGFVTFNSVSGGSIGAMGTPIAINTSHKIAFTLNASTSNVSVFINGVKIGTYATDITTFGAFSGLQTFGYNPASKVEQILIFPSVLTDAQCIELTTL
jgi:hypothetical protein